MSKYREMFRGDFAPKVALAALKRKVDKHARILGELQEDKHRAVTAAAARGPWDTFVTRDELRTAVESGELPEAWTEPETPPLALEKPADA